jgi:hypothetical protein
LGKRLKEKTTPEKLNMTIPKAKEVERNYCGSPGN